MTRSTRAVAVPLPTWRSLAPVTNDALAAGVFAGAVGASLFALFFLVVDLLVGGEALSTPSLVGAVVLQGASPLVQAPVDLGIVGAYSLVHVVLFTGFATLAALALVRLRTVPSLPLLALVLSLGLEGGFLAPTSLFAPGLGTTIGHGIVLAGNAVAGIAMAVIVRRYEDMPYEEIGATSHAGRTYLYGLTKPIIATVTGSGGHRYFREGCNNGDKLLSGPSSSSTRRRMSL